MKPAAITLTFEQRALARHALGLPNRRRKSFRNRFVAGPDHDDYAHWEAMVAMGAAKRHCGKALPFGGDDLFTLTLAGARAARLRGEGLDLEDFPRTEPLAAHGSPGGMTLRDGGAE